LKICLTIGYVPPVVWAKKRSRRRIK
jgi:hypothetical protein